MTPVIVAHGLWLPGFETAWLRKRLARAGFNALLFRFPTVRADLAENAARLADFASRVPGDRLHFLGFSLGGVVTLAMLRSTAWQRAGHVVCLGSPLNGSAAAARLAASGMGRQLLGRSMHDLLALGGLPPWRGVQPVGVIAGSAGFGFGRLLIRLARPNDGTVTVAETRLDGIADHVVVAAAHSALLFSRAAAAAAISFLLEGRFSRPA